MDKNVSQQLEQLQAALESWKGHEVVLSKRENGDSDEVFLELDNVSIIDRQPTIDDYVSTVSIQLEGHGTIHAGEAKTSLPYAAYEIPIEHIYDSSCENNVIHLTTDRGEYTISRI